METSKWYSKAYFYIVEIGELRKFGVTRNWYWRERRFKKQFPGEKVTRLFFDEHDKYWEADLVEGVVRKRLEPWIYLNTKEWVINDLPVECVKNCYLQTRNFLEMEYELHEFLHLEEALRYARYDQLYHVIKDRLDQTPLDRLGPLLRKYQK